MWQTNLSSFLIKDGEQNRLSQSVRKCHTLKLLTHELPSLRVLDTLFRKVSENNFFLYEMLVVV